MSGSGSKKRRPGNPRARKKKMENKEKNKEKGGSAPIPDKGGKDATGKKKETSTGKKAKLASPGILTQVFVNDEEKHKGKENENKGKKKGGKLDYYTQKEENKVQSSPDVRMKSPKKKEEAARGKKEEEPKTGKKKKRDKEQEVRQDNDEEEILGDKCDSDGRIVSSGDTEGAYSERGWEARKEREARETMKAMKLEEYKRRQAEKDKEWEENAKLGLGPRAWDLIDDDLTSSEEDDYYYRDRQNDNHKREREYGKTYTGPMWNPAKMRIPYLKAIKKDDRRFKEVWGCKPSRWEKIYGTLYDPNKEAFYRQIMVPIPQRALIIIDEETKDIYFRYRRGKLLKWKEEGRKKGVFLYAHEAEEFASLKGNEFQWNVLMDQNDAWWTQRLETSAWCREKTYHKNLEQHIRFRKKERKQKKRKKEIKRLKNLKDDEWNDETSRRYRKLVNEEAREEIETNGRKKK